MPDEAITDTGHIFAQESQEDVTCCKDGVSARYAETLKTYMKMGVRPVSLNPH
jgi:hypothetical protein